MIDAFHLIDTGYCRASEANLIRGGKHQTVDCHALIALLHHTREGWLLFDTGYSGPHLASATVRFPYRLYRGLLPARTQPQQSALAQAARFGLAASDIRHIIISHFHPDHIGGIKDFPRAHFVCDRRAWEQARSKTGSAALRRGLLPGLIPDDFADRAHFCDLHDGPPLSGSGREKNHDLFGDGTLLLVPLPGHARGQIGLRVSATPHGSLFLLADSVYLCRSVRENTPPHALTNFFTDDAQAVGDTVAHLHIFHKQHPDVILLPTHCPETFARVAKWGTP